MSGRYQYTTIEFWHTDPQLDLPGVVSINTVVDGSPRFAGEMEVA